VAIEGLADERLYRSLTADVQLSSSLIELIQHRGREVNVHPLHGLVHLSRIREEPGHIFPSVRHPRDRFGGGNSLLLPTGLLHIVPFPRVLRAIGLRNGSTRRAGPPESQKRANTVSL